MKAQLSIIIDIYELEVVHQFTYLVSTISANLSLDVEINECIAKAASTFARLTTHVWENAKLTVKTKIAVCSACIVSILFCSSEAWTTYVKQEKKLNSFHLHSLYHILTMSWRDKVPNNHVLSCSGLPTVYTLLRQCRLPWLGHIHQMEDSKIPKAILCIELASGKKTI